MYLTHYNDGKQKDNSHEIGLQEKDFLYSSDFYLCSHNPCDVIGYGMTPEEALEDFKDKFAYLMNELKAFEIMLFETDVITNDIKEVDCFGKLKNL